MCRLLAVSRSGFYAWRKRPPSPREQRRVLVGQAVEAVYHGFKKRYGAPRLTIELNEQGIGCSLNHVAKLLREKGLRARNGKGFKYRPHTQSRHNVSENLLGRNFEATKPNQKWVSDITYIKVGRIWLYLAVVLDLYSRKVIGWALDTHMQIELVLEAFTMAATIRDTNDRILLHSDRGVQYRGHEYQEALESHNIQCSMSRKGNCWDNAVMESFFSRLKVELIYAENFKRAEDAKAGIFEYIELFYNQTRRHSAIGYVSPNEYERRFKDLTVSTSRG